MATFSIAIAGSGVVADTTVSWTISDADTQTMLNAASARLGLGGATNAQIFTAAAQARVAEIIQNTLNYQASTAPPITMSFI